MVTPSAGGAQEALCLRLDWLPGWLFKIDSRRVRPAVRDKLIVYQRDCYRVLAEHFGLGSTAARRAGGAVPGAEPVVIFSPPRPDPEVAAFAAMPIAERMTWLYAVKECRLVNGTAAARALWRASPLPSVAVEHDDDRSGSAASVERFLSERVELVEGAEIGARELFDAYQAWAAGQGLQPVSETMFGRRVAESLAKVKRGTVRYVGARLRSDRP